MAVISSDNFCFVIMLIIIYFLETKIVQKPLFFKYKLFFKCLKFVTDII